MVYAEKVQNSITVTIVYDKELAKITGVASEPAVIADATIFLHMLFFIFQSYPEIEKLYPPGTLGMLVNNRPPHEFDLLQDGDEIKILAAKKSVNT